jgi:hypothetical protein
METIEKGPGCIEMPTYTASSKVIGLSLTGAIRARRTSSPPRLVEVVSRTECAD